MWKLQRGWRYLQILKLIKGSYPEYRKQILLSLWKRKTIQCKEWAKHIYFPKKDIQIAANYMIIWSACWPHIMVASCPPEWLKLVRQTTWLIRDNMQQQELLCTISGNKDCCNIFGKLELSKKMSKSTKNAQQEFTHSKTNKTKQDKRKQNKTCKKIS